MKDDTPLILKKAEHYLPKLREILENRGKTPEMPIKSLPDLNDILWGMPRGKVTVIAARTSIGKSAFALQIAYDLALFGKRVLFLSLEMTVEDMLERLFCYEFRINNRELTRGEFSKHTKQYEEFCNDFKLYKLVLNDCIGKRWAEVDTLIKQLNPKPDALFIDHINAINFDDFNQKRAIDDYLINIVEITKHQNISTTLCCQINRDNQKDDDKTPQLHELKGSGCIEEMADRVIMLHWPHKYQKNGESISKNKYLAIIGKNRTGPTGYVSIHFEPEFYAFSNGRTTAKEAKTKSKQDELNLLNQITEA